MEGGNIIGEKPSNRGVERREKIVHIIIHLPLVASMLDNGR